MRPIDNLLAEHEVILRVIDCLERIVDAGARVGHLDHHDAEQALLFVRDFSDSWHHGKEESDFFPALVARGLPKHGGPIAVMLNEHERGRAAINAMIASLPEASGGSETALVDFAHASREFIDLLRQHIRKENEILFPMSNSLLDEAAQKELASAFAKTEAQHPAGTQERLMKIAEELCQKYRVNWCESRVQEMPETGSFRSQDAG